MPKKKMPKIIPDSCVGCESCVTACPESCLEMNSDNIASMTKPDKCTSCESCFQACPSEAIKMEEQDYK